MIVQSHEPSRIIEQLAAGGLEVASEADVNEAHALALRLIGDGIATLETMRSIHEHTKTGIFVVRKRGEVVGVAAMLFLTPAGKQAVEDNTFDGLTPSLDHLVRPGEPVAGFYSWGSVADNARAGATVLTAVRIVRNEVMPDLPFYGRVSQKPGPGEQYARIAQSALRRLGCTFFPGQPDLLYSPKALPYPAYTRDSGRNAA